MTSGKPNSTPPLSSPQSPHPTPLASPHPHPPSHLTTHSDSTSSKPLSIAVSVAEKPPAQQTDREYDPSIGAKPSSPFYRHATPSSKLARLTSTRKRSRSVAVNSPIDDIEGDTPTWQRLYDDEALNRHESKLWGQKKRYCDCLGGLSKGQRLVVKIVSAVVILGAMVGVALGITAAVGGKVWTGENRSEVWNQ